MIFVQILPDDIILQEGFPGHQIGEVDFILFGVALSDDVLEVLVGMESLSKL